MSHSQQETGPSPNLPPEDLSPAEVEVGSWEPYLSMMKSWQRADEICAKAIDRAQTTRDNGETRVHSTFTTDKTNVEVGDKERLNALEAERKANRESADRLLAKVNTIERRVRMDMATIGLESLMDGIEAPALSERGATAAPLSSLQDIAERTAAIEKSLQEDLFALRSERQRQSAQMWMVGTALWLVSVIAFAPYTWISAFLVAVAVFVIGTPRKMDDSEPLRPSYTSHAAHCIALLFGAQQVMQYPFSLMGKDGDISTKAIGGATLAGFISWIFFFKIEQTMSYSSADLINHLVLLSLLSIVSGGITYALVNQEVTTVQIDEGERNKILR